MAFDKSLHPSCDTEGPFGVPMTDAVAKAIQSLIDEYKVKDSSLVKVAAAAEVSVDGDRTEVSKITTESVDRDREVILAKGIGLSSFKSNPVVLLNHNWYGTPLGKCDWIKNTTEGGPGLKAKTRYAKRPEEAQGEWIPDSILALIKQDMMPGKSIGFIPLERRSPEKSDIAANPHWKNACSIITKCELLEYSVVAIPSNAEALCETVWKSFPGLAALLPEFPKPAAVKSVTNPDEMTIAQLQAELAALKAERETWGPLVEKVAALEEDSERIGRVIRKMRKDSIRRPRPTKAVSAAIVTPSALEAAFRKIVSLG